MTPPSRSRILSRTVAPALALMLAGCLDVAPEESPEGSVPAPAWREGMRWNYTVHDAAGSQVGWTLYVVAGEDQVDGRATYRMDVTRQDADGPPRSRVEHFDRETLRGRQACGLDDGCQSEFPLFDFPLHEGKTWEHWCCGNDVDRVEAAVERVGEDAWRITHRMGSEGSGSPPRDFRSVVYSPSVGFVTLWEMSPGDNGHDETWRLSERA